MSRYNVERPNGDCRVHGIYCQGHNREDSTMSTPITVTLTPSEWDTILYALRFAPEQEDSSSAVTMDALADHVERQTQA